MQYLVVGLGNPTETYRHTRHNTGFMAVDYLAHCCQFSFSQKSRFKSLIAQGNLNENKLILAKPLTYMNLSGEAVQSIVSYHKITPDRMVVIHDDIDLETGKIKLKLAGGSGGHNGLKSIDSIIGNNYYRIRIGIGKPEPRVDVSSYVLGNFEGAEFEKIISSIILIVDNFNLLLAGRVEEFKKLISR